MAAASTSPTGVLGQQERVICVLKSSDVPGQYDVISLEEQTDNQKSSFHLSSHSTTDVPKTLLDGFLVDSLPEYLRGNDTRKVHVVVSTGSGTGHALDFYQSALQPLLEKLALSPAESSAANSTKAPSNGTYHVHVTQGPQSIQRFARDLSLSLKGIGGTALNHTVILLSGDGGTVELLNGKAPVDEAGVPDTSLPLIAVLPLGTGNALFHSLHKPFYTPSDEPEPSPLVLGLRTLLRGKQAPLPSFRVDFSLGSQTISYVDPKGAQSESGVSAESVVEESSMVSHLYGVIVASYGFHSQLVWESDTPEYRKHGAKRFQMVAAELLKENHAYHAIVEPTSGEEGVGKKLDRETHAYILTTMVSNLEKAFTISPASLPLDGKLRLIHFAPVDGQKAMEIMTQAYNNGNHVGMEWTAEDGKTVERVGYEEAERVQVTVLEDNPRWRKVCIDGTIVEIPNGGSMTVAKDSRAHLQVLVHQSLNSV
jgi:diacylglycerol kinase family enzyme